MTELKFAFYLWMRNFDFSRGRAEADQFANLTFDPVKERSVGREGLMEGRQQGSARSEFRVKSLCGLLRTAHRSKYIPWRI
jgi:hypothetical protein